MKTRLFEKSLKLKLQGLIVSDANNSARQVLVRYKNPETEIADLNFPIIIISHDGWYPATERMHDGYVNLPYAPENYNPWFADTGPETTDFNPDDSPYYSWFPIAYNFDYVITVYTRFMHEHMIPIVSSLAQYDRLHAKYGYLDVPQDGTKRTMQLLGGPALNTGKDVNDKRLFWADYKIRVFSELVPEIVQPVLANLVNLDLSVYSSTENLTIASVQESKSLLSVGVPITWNVNQPI
jgi:hypothetical protein